MNVFERLRHTQRILGAAAIAQALIWGFAATFAIIALASFAAVEDPSLSRHPTLFHDLAFFIGVAVGVAFLWRSRRFAFAKRVALWVEERVPELHYALITALEDAESNYAEEMERVVEEQDVTGATMAAIRRPIVYALAALVISVALLYVSPPGAFGRAHAFSPLGHLHATGAVPAGSRLENIEVVITPPGYAGGRGTTIDDPTSVDALAGSTIAVRGKGSPLGLTASLSTPLRISAASSGWNVSFSMPPKPSALTLRDRNYERVIVLAPRADAAPKIALTSPVHDTTLRVPKLAVQLNATVTDDIGLADGYFEYLITTGSGEIFSARTITTAVAHFGGSRSGSLTATLDLATLKLGEGDILSMRAIARDGNTLSGPGIATSDTRTIRIARAGEYDSLAIEAAAPQPIDSSAMSQRMLIVMTEQLVREQSKLTRQDLVKRSTEIGDMEERIRRRVHEILTENEEEIVAEKPGDSAQSIEEMEAPEQITGKKNPDLVMAYNALWQAVRSLQIAEPAPALPPMGVALKALDRARVANRLYLRGAPPRIIVDLQRVRLTGKEKGSSNTRTPRSFADSARVRLSARFNAVLELIEKQPARAITELALMRVEGLPTLPDFAAALGEAADAIRVGRDATLPMLRARRALDGPPRATPGLPAWSGGE